MPTRVTLRVKQGSALPVHERHPIAKKQRTSNIPSIPRKSEIVPVVEEVTVKTEEINDGSISCNDGLSKSVLCEPSYNSHLSHKPSTSSNLGSNSSKQCKSQFNDEFCSFKGSLESDIIGLSNQDSKSYPLNNGKSELQYKEVAQQISITHETSDVTSAWNNDSKRKRLTWDERFQEIVDFKKSNGHTNVPQRYGLLGRFVNNQRTAYRRFKEGNDSSLTHERCKQLEGIGFLFVSRPSAWDDRFQELVYFKTINGHSNVPQCSGQLGTWVDTQRQSLRRLEEGKSSPLTSDKCKKLSSLGFEFKCRPKWDERFQELVDFKNVNGHSNVPRASGPLGRWVSTQRTLLRLLKKSEYSPLINERQEKLKGIGFRFNTIYTKS